MRFSTSGAPILLAVFSAWTAVGEGRAEPLPSASTGIEIVVVTAERREENANRVGMAIKPLTADSLINSRVTNSQDLSLVVPGLTVAKGAGVPIYTLRGIGFNSTNLSSTGTVGTYVDEVDYPFPFMTRGPLFDVSRVEVLKGPQGTLYGQNTTGGLIDLITNKPDDALAGGFTAEFGNYGTYNFEGYANLPISDQLQTRIAFRSENSGAGWQKSFTRPEDKLGKVDRLGVRGEVAWSPSSDFDALLTVNYWRDRSDTEAGQFVALLPTAPAPFIVAGLPAFIAAFHPTSDTTAEWEPATQVRADGLLSTGLHGPLAYDDDFYGLALHANYHFNQSLTLVSITGYNYLTRDDINDSGGTPFEESGTTENSGYARTFSQELRLDGENGPVRWLAGGYFETDDTYDQIDTLSGQGSVDFELRFFASLIQGIPFFNPNGYSLAQIADGLRDFRFTGLQHSSTLSGFGSATWDISDEFSLTGGIRYSQDRLKYIGGAKDRGDGDMLPIWNTIVRALILGFPGPLVNPDPGLVAPGQYVTLNSTTHRFSLVPIPEKLNQNPLTWHTNLNYKPSDDTLFYLTISQGVKSGAVPVIAANVDTQLLPAKQETLLAYEVGVKKTFFNDFQANVSAFYYDYTDKQLVSDILDPIFTALPRLVNVPKSRVYGVDADLAWRASEDLTLGLSGTYVDSRITKFTGFNVSGAPVDYRGSSFSFAPKFQGSASVLYQHPISDDLGFRLTANGSYQSDTFSIIVKRGDPTAAPYHLKSYGLLNGTIGVYTLDGKWDASIWGENLTDTYYWTNVIATIDNASRLPGLPRTFGLRVSAHFQ